ncbi:MAG: hypothetical protein IT379_35125, partial [Deltaproteobacteria bacterium]|nr:hypothetical protein [Deltaproteobacteria bacterium]
ALRTALEVGDAPVLVRALAWESIVSALAGDAPSRARADDLAAAAEQLAQHVAEPHALAWAMSAAAVAAACEDRWQRTFDLCEYAEALFRQESADSAWEVATLGVWWRLPAVLHLGAVEDLAAMLGDLLHEADLRGDLYCATTARVHLLPQLLLLRDRPTEALDEIRLALTRWPSGWHLQHWAAAMSRCEAQLYRGETSAALEGLERAWPSMLAADQLALHHVRVRSHHVRARAAIAFASKHGNAGVHALLRESLDALAAESSPWATACASAVEAALVLPDEGPDAAAVMLDLASQRFAALDMTVLAAATRAQASRLATPSGPHAQPAHVALASLSARGVRRPEALVTALVPLLA